MTQHLPVAQEGVEVLGAVSLHRLELAGRPAPLAVALVVDAAPEAALEALRLTLEAPLPPLREVPLDRLHDEDRHRRQEADEEDADERDVHRHRRGRRQREALRQEVAVLLAEIGDGNDHRQREEDGGERPDAHQSVSEKKPCSAFSWQSTQYRAQGTAFNRGSPIASPQFRQTP